MRPYYEQDGITLYHADCRDVSAFLLSAESCIVDPVWPNAVPELAGSDNPGVLFAGILDHLHHRIKRLVVHLGCDSDPRFLWGVPSTLPFFRACHLEYVRPHYKGRMLYTHDIAYVFGEPPEPKRGAMVMPGRCVQNDAAKRPKGHPCPRQLQHVAWLVKWFGGESVVDPCCGTGTTLLAAKQAGIRAVGVEVEERYCEIAAKRLAQGVLFGVA